MMCYKGGVMGKKKFFYLSLFGGIVFFCLIALTVVIFIHRNKEEEVLSADDVGITRIFNEKIVSVEFNHIDPNFIGNCEDVSVISPLLDIAVNAVYQPVRKPRQKKMGWLEMVYIGTDAHNYSLGYINGVFVFGVDGDRKYYECSEEDIFLNQFDEILDQWALTGQKKYL